MRRICPVLVVLLLAACSSVPRQSARTNGMTITTPRAFKPPADFPHFVDHSVGQEEISIQAMSLVGVPYRWGGNTPASGFDCSGLVRYVVGRAADVNLPRTTADMSGRGVEIEPDQVAPGDLIFFNTTGRPHSHVGIYVGKLRFVNAPSTGGTVRLDYLTNPYWAKRFDGIRRVAPPRATPFDSPTYEARRNAAPPQAEPALAAAVAPAPVVAPSPSPAIAPIVAAQARAPMPVAAPMPAPVPSRGATASASADPYEPPPAHFAAAQQQSAAAVTVAPAVESTAELATEPAAASASSDESVRNTGTSIPTVAVNPSDLPGAATSDTFAPPPSMARAAGRPAGAGARAPDPVQVLRASTQSAPVNAGTRTGDDPIARFANGSD
ncbi:C40 family peptidase [Burkholderia guangdongensis]|uniref:C40 family peptidase n=1 Tax=Burkholderia guangdongensis TaxID=1792500 RepID=UPI0015CD3947|nr:C40 family peptidase [Burkholderia guangdongensis]